MNSSKMFSVRFRIYFKAFYTSLPAMPVSVEDAMNLYFLCTISNKDKII